MRVTIAIVGAVVATVAVASPITSSSPLSRRQGPPGPKGPMGGPMGPGAGVAGAGPCPMNCWNEAAVVAGCDPNADDSCLCGPFFDAVTSCSAATCSMGENLAALSFLNPACE
ncbi:hypothetical protein BKA58DRAFT_438941 [Alternaria rosae]|uniref:uncharacterized protein n=1 Tax=Alternaria rosae TaxID=1187941 RepID=UPI001E8CB4CC|nr:uncharacterized protein BKA58DRAFT_438941 [Alternaria rosae]KAH6872848.1 hypothetical protein BKA58DRAFT_438941 [Alternaria rosae]